MTRPSGRPATGSASTGLVSGVPWGLLVLLLLLLAACGGAGGTAGDPATGAPAPTTGTAAPTAAPPTTPPVTGTVRLYTSVTQDTVDAVVDAFSSANPDARVEVFRAPTGELNARVAAERRDGDLLADVLWLTDPLSMQDFAADGLLREWTPTHADAVPAGYREETFWGTRLLHMVIVHQPGLPSPPAGWADLAAPDRSQPVALPDPGFAGSAFGALGWFALADDFGFDFYRALAEAGAVQVQAPGEVVTGVAEGRFSAGMTLARIARDAIADGAPVELVVPRPGAIAVYSPVAVVAASDEPAAAEAFADFTISAEGQRLIASTGWQPVRPDIAFDDRIVDTVAPDWPTLFDRQDELLERYRSVLGG